MPAGGSKPSSSIGGRPARRWPVALALFVLVAVGNIPLVEASPQPGDQPTRTLDVTPGDGANLPTPAAITVNGVGFANGNVGASGSLAEYAPTPTGFAVSQDLGFFTATSAGTFSASINVTRTFVDQNGGGTIDCFVSACSVEAFSIGTGMESRHTISFAGAGDAFHPLTPARVLDSRPPPLQVGPYATPWSPREVRDVTVAGVGGVPAGADAVVLNVTATDTTAPGYLTIWPKGQTQPLASSLNWAAGQTIPNAVTVKVGAVAKVSMLSSAGSADVIVDVVGYYDALAGDGYTPLAPARILDSRPAGPQVGPYGSPWGPSQLRDVTVTGVGGVAAGADAVVLNVTVTDTTAPGYLTVWPAGQTRPLASSLNWSPGQTIPNAVTVKVGAGGKVSVFNAAGSTNVIVDVVGAFAAGSGLKLHPLFPARVQDSRPAGPQVGPYGTPWGAGVARDVQVAGAGGIPSGAAAALLNVTATATTAASYLTVWPAGQAAPLASSLNWAPGATIANSVTTKLSATGRISIKNAAGNVDVIADTAGWYG